MKIKTHFGTLIILFSRMFWVLPSLWITDRLCQEVVTRLSSCGIHWQNANILFR